MTAGRLPSIARRGGAVAISHPARGLFATIRRSRGAFETAGRRYPCEAAAIHAALRSMGARAARVAPQPEAVE